jgi:hypothetical protein
MQETPEIGDKVRRNIGNTQAVGEVVFINPAVTDEVCVRWPNGETWIRISRLDAVK